MSNHGKTKRLDYKDLHILDLPEQIFREIFLYLDDHSIVNLKTICNQIKSYVNNYVEVERRFLVLYNSFDSRFPMESIHMIKCPTKNPRILARMRGFGVSESNLLSPCEKHAFATNIRKNNVVGIFYAHENCRSHKFESTTFHLYSFNSKYNKWNLISPNPPEDNLFLANNSLDFSSQIMCSHITELDVAVFHIIYVSEKSFIQLIRFHVNEDDDKLTYSSSYSLAPEKLCSLRGFFLGQKGRGEIILFGGSSDMPLSNCWGFISTYMTNVWDGTLSVDGTEIIWKDTNHALPIMKSPRFMFYFNDYIYILEGLEDSDKNESIRGLPCTSEEFGNLGSSSAYPTCHKYCLTDKKYYENIYRLPESWYAFSRSYKHLVSVDKTNQFVLIIARNLFCDGTEKNNDDRRRILFFTEKEGFQETLKGKGRWRKEQHDNDLRNNRSKDLQTENSAIFLPQTV